MNTNEINGIRIMAEAVTTNGKWMVCVKHNGVREVKAFDLTRTRAEEWAKHYRGGYIEQMA